MATVKVLEDVVEDVSSVGIYMRKQTIFVRCECKDRFSTITHNINRDYPKFIIIFGDVNRLFSQLYTFIGGDVEKLECVMANVDKDVINIKRADRLGTKTETYAQKQGDVLKVVDDLDMFAIRIQGNLEKVTINYINSCFCVIDGNINFARIKNNANIGGVVNTCDVTKLVKLEPISGFNYEIVDRTESNGVEIFKVLVGIGLYVYVGHTLDENNKFYINRFDGGRCVFDDAGDFKDIQIHQVDHNNILWFVSKYCEHRKLHG